MCHHPVRSEPRCKILGHNFKGLDPEVLQIREISTGAVVGGVTEERTCRSLCHRHCPVPSPSEPVKHRRQRPAELSCLPWFRLLFPGSTAAVPPRPCPEVASPLCFFPRLAAGKAKPQSISICLKAAELWVAGACFQAGRQEGRALPTPQASWLHTHGAMLLVGLLGTAARGSWQPASQLASPAPLTGEFSLRSPN